VTKRPESNCATFIADEGATEITGLDNDGLTKMQGWTLHDWTQTDGVAKVDFAGLDNDGRLTDCGVFGLL